MKMMHTPVNHNFTINKRGVQKNRLVSHFVHEILIVEKNKSFFFHTLRKNVHAIYSTISRL